MKTPIIGREENLNAAVMFAVKDPEDSDVNSMFAAIEMYDELRKVEPNVEVATIAGSPSVGYQSDRILASQLEQVIEKVKPEEVILVSDGAEDEAVYPIISSRVRISSVRKVVVKQHRGAEGTFYVLKSAVREKHFLTPIALIFLMLSSSALVSMILSAVFFPDPALGGTTLSTLLNKLPGIGVAMLGIMLAFYMIAYTYDWSRRLSKWYEDTSQALRTGRVRLTTNMIAIVLLVIGAVIVDSLTANTPGSAQPWPRILNFASIFLWFVMGSALTSGIGRALDAYFSTGRFQYSYLVVGFSLLGITAGLFAALRVLLVVLQTSQPDLFEVLSQFGVWLLLAIAIGIGGGIFGRKVRRMERKLRAAKEAKLQADGGDDEFHQKIRKKKID